MAEKWKSHLNKASFSGKFGSYVNDWKRLYCWFMLFNLFTMSMDLANFSGHSVCVCVYLFRLFL